MSGTTRNKRSPYLRAAVELAVYTGLRTREKRRQLCTLCDDSINTRPFCNASGNLRSRPKHKLVFDRIDVPLSIRILRVSRNRRSGALARAGSLGS